MCISGQLDNQCVDTNAECVVQSGTTEPYKCLCKSQYYANTTEVCAKYISAETLTTGHLILSGTNNQTVRLST